jgi:NADPH:quinone reductase-like Zn-dependent oxidoreductase
LVLVEKAGLKKGDSVLVNEVSGGIGHMVIQMVKKKLERVGGWLGSALGGMLKWLEPWAKMK